MLVTRIAQGEDADSFGVVDSFSFKTVTKMIPGSKVKQSRKEKEAELAEVIAELSLQVEIKGSCRKPTWRDQPVVLLAMFPVHAAT